MGYGAFVHITNGTKDIIQVHETSSSCMYGTGDWGNVIFPGKTHPSQYIEAKASGSCATEHSGVTYEIRKLGSSGYEEIGKLTLRELSHNWSVGEPTKNVTVDKIEESEQAHMFFTVT